MELRDAKASEYIYINDLFIGFSCFLFFSCFFSWRRGMGREYGKRGEYWRGGVKLIEGSGLHLL